jgi:hypothetical protein
MWTLQLMRFTLALSIDRIPSFNPWQRGAVQATIVCALCLSIRGAELNPPQEPLTFRKNGFASFFFHFSGIGTLLFQTPSQALGS